MKADITPAALEERALVQAFGARVRKSRIEQGLPQTELAALANVTVSWITRIEQGGHRTNVSLAVIQRLARALEMTYDELLDGLPVVSQRHSRANRRHRVPLIPPEADPRPAGSKQYPATLRRDARAGIGGRDLAGGAVTVVVGRFDPVVACGLGVILGDDRGFCVLASDLELDALERAVAQRVPQVAIVDERAEGAVLGRLCGICPATAIVVFADDPSPAYGKLLLAAGATCVARAVSGADFVAIVRLAAQGNRIFATSDGERVQRCYPNDVDLLTRREREVFVHLSKGESYSRIACELRIGVRTTESYAARVREKLRVSHKQELVGMPVPRDWTRG